MSFYKQLKDNYGKSCLDDIRRLEVTVIKIARHRNHLRFNLHCKHHSVIPQSLHLKSAVKGSKADNILRRTERALLNVRIGQTIRKLDYLEKDKSRLSDIVYGDTSALPDNIRSQVKVHHERA